jgi:DNA-directed RNA polymerase specialized sigma subunit
MPLEAFAQTMLGGAPLDDIRLRDTMSRDMRRACNVISKGTARLTQQFGRRPAEAE